MINDDEYLLFKDWPEESFGSLTPNDAAYYRSELEHAEICWNSQNVRKLSILEIGFGNGSFLSYCRAQDFDVAGIEVSIALIRRARERGYRTYADLNSIPSGTSYDAIVAFNVIEHIPENELPIFFNKVKSLLKKGGVFITKFPNGDSPFGRLYQYGDITHRTVIGSGKVEFLASSVGLDLVYCGPPAEPIFGVRPALMVYRLVARPIRFVFECLIRSLYFPRIKVSFAVNLTAVFRRP